MIWTRDKICGERVNRVERRLFVNGEYDEVFGTALQSFDSRHGFVKRWRHIDEASMCNGSILSRRRATDRVAKPLVGGSIRGQFGRECLRMHNCHNSGILTPGT
jgi:hypothetical protein